MIHGNVNRKSSIERDSPYDSLTKKIKKDSNEYKSMHSNSLQEYIHFPQTIALLEKRNIKYLFPIQTQTFNFIYNSEDVIARDRTGSGKTLAYALPITERLRKKGHFDRKKTRQRPLVLTVLPTRELALQVAKEFKALCHTDREFRFNI